MSTQHLSQKEEQKMPLTPHVFIEEVTIGTNVFPKGLEVTARPVLNGKSIQSVVAYQGKYIFVPSTYLKKIEQEHQHAA